MRGLDYGHGRTNVDSETGIRFGYLSWFDLDPEIVSDIDMAAQSAWVAEFGDSEDGPEGTPTGYIVEVEGLLVMPLEDGVFVVKSSHLAWDGEYCSPCAPGAVDLPACRVRHMALDARPSHTEVGYDVPPGWIYVPET